MSEKFKTLCLDRKMYEVEGKTFTQVLERLDPSENYCGSTLEGLDAFERQLKRFGIRTSGSNSDVLEKFFQTNTSSILFPEFVRRTVKEGIESAEKTSKIVATTTMIDSMDYRSIATIPVEDDINSLQEINIKTKSNLAKLHKRGKRLNCSYEALRFQRLDLFAVSLRKIGVYIAKAQFKDAINVIINGDGENNWAEQINSSSIFANPYTNIELLSKHLSPFDLTTMIFFAPSLKEYYKTKEIVSQNTSSSDSLKNILYVPEKDSGDIIGLDKNCALEMVKVGDVQVEHDLLIDRQFERTSIYAIAGFSKIWNDACKIVTPII